MGGRAQDQVRKLINDYIAELLKQAHALTPEQRLRLHGLLYGPGEPEGKPYPANRRGSRAWREAQRERQEREAKDDDDPRG